MTKILIRNDQKALPFSMAERKIIRTAVNAAIAAEDGGSYEVSVLITDDARIQELNKTYRNIDRATDVLSFPMDIEEHLLGDIVISLEHAYAQAEEYGHSPQRELSFLTVHSMLHLYGYDHEEEADRRVMREAEERILTGLGLQRE